MVVNDDSSVVIKLATSLIADARVVIYDRHMFIVQATGRSVTWSGPGDLVSKFTHCFL